MPAPTRSPNPPRISVVIPLLNEEEVLPELHKRVASSLQQITSDFEVIFVNDGSTDATPALTDRIHDQDPRFKCIHFSRNFGHQAAVTAGLAYSSGAATCVIDADLQDPPELIPILLHQLEQGHDVVYAVRRNRQEAWIKVRFYNLFYRILSRLSSVPIPLDAGDFCLMSRRVLDQVNALPEKDRFVRGLRAWVGFSQVGVEYDRDARQGGRTKYSIVRLLRLATSGIVSFSHLPLTYMVFLGVLISVLSMCYAAWLAVSKFLFGGQVTGYASLMGGLLFFSGVQMLFLGVIGTYLARVFEEIKARPTYIVKTLRGLST